MKVRQEDGKWVVREEGGTIRSTHDGKAAALVSIGYRGRVAPPPAPKQSPKRARKGQGNAKPRTKR